MLSRLGYFSIVFAFAFFIFGCQSFVGKKEKMQKENDEFGCSNLLRFKVKEEDFRKDSLSLIFEDILFEEVSLNEYDLRINVDFKRKNIAYYQDYYLILAIYPRDNEIQLLSADRLKYKFESFSIKLRKNEVEDLVIARKIKTNLNFARAITISVIEYKTKLKSKEIVLQNVKF